MHRIPIINSLLYPLGYNIRHIIPDFFCCNSVRGHTLPCSNQVWRLRGLFMTFLFSLMSGIIFFYRLRSFSHYCAFLSEPGPFVPRGLYVWLSVKSWRQSEGRFSRTLLRTIWKLSTLSTAHRIMRWVQRVTLLPVSSFVIVRKGWLLTAENKRKAFKHKWPQLLKTLYIHVSRTQKLPSNSWSVSSCICAP